MLPLATTLQGPAACRSPAQPMCSRRSLLLAAPLATVLPAVAFQARANGYQPSAPWKALIEAEPQSPVHVVFCVAQATHDAPVRLADRLDVAGRTPQATATVDGRLPEMFSVAWFSYADDAFFRSTVLIDGARLANRFREGATFGAQARTVDAVVLGLGAGGRLSVMAGSSTGRTDSVSSFTAPRVDVHWASVFADVTVPRAVYVAQRLRDLRRAT